MPVRVAHHAIVTYVLCGETTMNQPASETSNRRSWRRQKAKSSTKVTCCKGAGLGRNFAVSVLDISVTGIRLLVSAALEQGQEVEITLQGLGQRRPCKLPATVMWCVSTADGNCCIGARFQRNLPYSDLQLIACM
jgi:hypothetical protein